MDAFDRRRYGPLQASRERVSCDPGTAAKHAGRTVTALRRLVGAEVVQRRHVPPLTPTCKPCSSSSPFPLSLLGLLVWPGGSQRCYNCQLGREVRVFASVEVPIWISNTECSRWVRRNLPDHEHRWMTGNWSTWNSIRCSTGGGGFGISSERWFRALQAAEPAERPVLMELANRGASGADRRLAREELERRVARIESEANARGAALSPR